VPVQERQRGPRTPVRFRTHALTAPPLTCWLHSPAPAPARSLAAPEQPQPPQRQRSRRSAGAAARVAASAVRARYAMAMRCFCFSDGSLTFDARPSARSRRTHCHVTSNCHHSKPCRALRARAGHRQRLPPGRQGGRGGRLQACQRLALTTAGSGRRQAGELLSGAASRPLLAQARRCGYATALLAARPAHLNSNAWWLLCQPSPNASTATHQLLRLRTHAHASHKYAGKHAGAQNNSHAELWREHNRPGAPTALSTCATLTGIARRLAGAPLVAGVVRLVAPHVAGRVDEPGDVVHPGAAQRAAPHHRRQAADGEQRGEHGQHVQPVGALDEAVERLAVQVARVAARAHALQRRLRGPVETVCTLLRPTPYHNPNLWSAQRRADAPPRSSRAAQQPRRGGPRTLLSSSQPMWLHQKPS